MQAAGDSFKPLESTAYLRRALCSGCCIYAFYAVVFALTSWSCACAVNKVLIYCQFVNDYCFKYKKNLTALIKSYVIVRT